MFRKVSVVLLALALGASPAFAKKELSPARKALVEIGQNEAESMQLVMDAIDATQPLPVSDGSKAKWEEAQDAHAAAAKLWKKGKYPEAYDKFSEAGDLVQPALGELLVAENPPQDVIDAAAAQVNALAKMVDGLARAVEEHGTEESKAAYAQAKGLFDEAQAMWPDPTKRREAAEKAWQATKLLNEGIRHAWEAAQAT